jgi:two-component system phosphate regulon response regulator PhoB
LYMLAAEATQKQPTLRLGRVLVVDDEEIIRETIALALQEEGYEVCVAADGRTAYELTQVLEHQPTPERSPFTEFAPSSKASIAPVATLPVATLPLVVPSNQRGDSGNFDLIILDLMLPYINGLDLCRLLRRDGNSVPIIILSAKGSETDRVVGLEVGADDYLTKPFGMRELIARCRALLRRSRQTEIPQAESTFLKYQDITLYLNECRVIVRGEEISFSPKEFRILELFMSYPRRVWSREQLLDRIWGPDFMGDSKTVDVHIRWLREKLELDPSHPKYLQTVRGFGYRFG